MKTLSDLSLANQRVLLRADLNAPMKLDSSGVMQITDDGRLVASVPTIKYLQEQGAKIIVMAHLGRPKGERKSELSLKPIANRLSELLNSPITFIDNLNDEQTLSVVNNLAN